MTVACRFAAGEAGRDARVGAHADPRPRRLVHDLELQLLRQVRRIHAGSREHVEELTRRARRNHHRPRCRAAATATRTRRADRAARCGCRGRCSRSARTSQGARTASRSLPRTRAPSIENPSSPDAWTISRRNVHGGPSSQASCTSCSPGDGWTRRNVRPDCATSGSTRSTSGAREAERRAARTGSSSRSRWSADRSRRAAAGRSGDRSRPAAARGRRCRPAPASAGPTRRSSSAGATADRARACRRRSSRRDRSRRRSARRRSAAAPGRLGLGQIARELLEELLPGTRPPRLLAPGAPRDLGGRGVLGIRGVAAIDGRERRASPGRSPSPSRWPRRSASRSAAQMCLQMTKRSWK